MKLERVFKEWLISHPNIQWGTQKENIIQARDEGRLPNLFISGPSNPSFGKRKSPLSISEEKQIVNEVLSGKFTKVQIANNHGISRSCINPILKKKRLWQIVNVKVIVLS